MKVVIIGSGNVATVLGRLVQGAGHTIVKVYSRHLAHAEALAASVHAAACDRLEELETAGAGMHIIAVTDTALQAIAPALRLSSGIAVHTSGASGAEILAGCAPGYGVLYPLQSIRKETTHLPVLPLLTEGATPQVAQTIFQFAQTLSPLVQAATAAERLKLHLAAVLTSNFANHLYTLASDYCEQQQLPFTMLVPLIQETAARLSQYAPAQMQTGPAIRHDQATMDKHLALLQQNKKLQEIYRLLSGSIEDYYR